MEREHIRQALATITLEQREQCFRPDGPEAFFTLIQQGNMRSAAEAERYFASKQAGTLSDDPLRHCQYVLVASSALAAHYCREGGLDAEQAHALAGNYIHRADACQSVEEIAQLHDLMVRDFTGRMQAMLHTKESPAGVYEATHYIESHVHEPLTPEGVAAAVDAQPANLASVFKETTGQTLSEYIRTAKIDTARLLLQYTDVPIPDISDYLCFRSPASFYRAFRTATGMSASQFRKQANPQAPARKRRKFTYI